MYDMNDFVDYLPYRSRDGEEVNCFEIIFHGYKFDDQEKLSLVYFS